MPMQDTVASRNPGGAVWGASAAARILEDQPPTGGAVRSHRRAMKRSGHTVTNLEPLVVAASAAGSSIGG